MAASAAAAPQLWAPAYTDEADPDKLIGEAEEDIIRRSKHAGWVYEFQRMAKEREDSQWHTYAFCALKATGHLCNPLLIDELRESGGETPGPHPAGQTDGALPSAGQHPRAWVRGRSRGRNQ